MQFRVPSSIQRIVLTRCGIETLSDTTVQSLIAATDLEKLDLSNNRIETIPGDLFYVQAQM